MADLSVIEPTLASIKASQQTLDLLRDLHTQALSEPAYVSTDSQPVEAALQRFVALDPDKCALLYHLLRSSRARHVVEAGTSFGLSTIYLALAVAQNAGPDGDGTVVATENEPTKASRAREHWQSAGDGIADRIDLREGDLRETLQTDLPEQVDFLLLDSECPLILLDSDMPTVEVRRLLDSRMLSEIYLVWTPLALPALRLVRPRMRAGAQVVADNTVSAAKGYGDLMAYLDDPQNGFRYTTAPYAGGLLIATYVG